MIRLALKDGTRHIVEQELINKLTKIYKPLDVTNQLIQMQGYLILTKNKRPTKRGVNRFIANWLNKHYNKIEKPVNNKKRSFKHDLLFAGFVILRDKGIDEFNAYCKNCNLTEQQRKLILAKWSGGLFKGKGV